jgi:ABC-type Na+ efflux pump permease subunit
MSTRWGLGPVFAFEWLTNSRRWQVYALRSLFVAALLASVSLIWWTEVRDHAFPTIQAQAAVGAYFYNAIVGVALALILLAAPAATAGSICLDKARGTLDHLLATDLSDGEIVLGKLAARSIPTVGVVWCALPVMAFGTLLGGIDPKALAGSFFVLIGVAVLGSALALTLSVWGRKTHEVLMATYLVIVAWLLSVPAGAWFLWTLGFGAGTRTSLEPLKYTNPFYLVLARYNEPGQVTLLTSGGFLAASLLISLLLARLAVARVRVVALRQAARPQTATRRLPVPAFPAPRIAGWPAPTLDGNPVLWREWHRRQPSRWSRVVWALYVAGSAVALLLAFADFMRHPRGPSHESIALVSAFATAIGMLLLSVSAATSLAEERVRGSLDVLLATPLPTKSILWGKWWGTFRAVPRLAALPLSAAAVLALYSGRWGHVLLLGLLILAYGAAITSLGLAVATWVARLGRAVGLTVAVYVFVTVAWVFLVVALLARDNFFGPGLAMGSPFFGIAFGTLSVNDGYGGPVDFRRAIPGFEVFWTLVYGAVAAGLFGATLATFDRRLGRVSEHVGLRPIAPRARPKPAPLAELDELPVA